MVPVLWFPSVLRSEKSSTDDETLQFINKPKHPKKGKTRNKMEGPPKKVNHKGNIKFLKPILSQEAYQIGKGEDLLKGHLA
jgi:hypothetical protein